jgi:glutamine amidotransferase
MQTAVLIDYGSGNLRSAEKALLQAASRLGEPTQVLVTGDPLKVLHADRLILLGVGAFAACIGAIRKIDGLEAAMNEAIARGAPFLGVCVGMQLLATRGLEFGETPGLDWIAGEVRRIEPGDPHLKVPHMGWNALEADHGHPLLEGLTPGGHMYFTHSFVLHPQDETDVVAWTTHGERFAAAVARNNVAGVQFHPEKSQAQGLALLGDFLEWRP